MTIVDVSATDAAGTTRRFGSGRYTMAFIGIADGGAYDAYGLWSHRYLYTDPRSGSNCQNGLAQCRYGYQHAFWTVIDGTSTIYRLASDLSPPIARYYRFATTAAALRAAEAGPYNRALEFTLDAPASVRFAVDDTSHWDNEGGLSLLVTRVPEPSNWAMLVVGFSLIGLIRRRRTLVTSA